MYLSVSTFIGQRYSKAQNHTGFVSFITFFSIAGILLGVASLITVVSVMNGFEGELKKRILGLVPHVEVSADNAVMTDWQATRNSLLAHPLVSDVTPFLSNEVLIQSNSQLKGVLLQGILPEYEENHIVAKHMVLGELSTLNESPYSIIIGQSLARELNVSLNDKLRIVLPQKMLFTPMGRLPVQRTFTVKGIFNVGSQVDSAMVYIHLRDSAKLNRLKRDSVQELRLYLHDAFTAAQFVNESPLPANGYSYSIWNESQGALFSAVKMEKNMMWLMLSLIIAVAAFNIVSALVMVVIDKQAEIGILQTLGMNRAGVIKVFLTQGLINGLWGVLVGALLGVTIALNLNEILQFLGVNVLGGYGEQSLPIDLKMLDVIKIMLGALLMCFIATLYPAYKASQTQPAEVLRNE